MTYVFRRRRRNTTESAAAVYLAVTTQPVGGTSGSTLATQPVVAAKKSRGTTDTTFTGNVTLAVNTVTGSHSLGGTLTVACVAGVATFTNVTDTGSGDATLTASATGLTSATSASFTTSAGVTHTFADDFAGTDGQNVTARANTWAGGAGVGSWVKLGAVNLLIKSNRAYGDFDIATYRSAATVAANGIWRGVYYRLGTSAGTFLLRSRRDETADSSYEVQYGAGTWGLRKRVSGAFGTVAGTPADVSDTWPVGQYRTVELETTSSGVIARVYGNDGTTLIGTMTSTDTSVSAAGYGRIDLHGTPTDLIHIDSLEFIPT